MDVKSVFLKEILHEEVYMQIPEGVEAGNNKVYKLNKSIYGLKQSSRCWYERFDSTQRKKSDYTSKNTSHAFVAGFFLAILVKKSCILGRDPFMLKKY